MTQRIALWTPLPPVKSGIADYIVPLLPYISKGRDLEIFIDDNYIPDQILSEEYNIFTYHDFADREKASPFDLNIYQLGNNEFHLYLYNQMLTHPGLVISHDLSISMILHHYYGGILNNINVFLNEFEYSEGLEARSQADTFLKKGDGQGLYKLFATHYMMRRVVERSYGITTHLDFTADILKERYGGQNIYKIHHFAEDPYQLLPEFSKKPIKKLPKDKFFIGVFGFIQKTKQISVILKAFSRLIKKYPNAHLLFVGEVNPDGGYDEYLDELINKLEIREHITMTGFVTHEEFTQYLTAVNTIIVLRWPSYGQMSGTIARGIASGKPLIISDVPEWKEFPDTFCKRVPPEDTNGEQLEFYLSEMLSDPEIATARGAMAREFFKEHLAIDKVGKQLTAIIDDVVDNKSPILNKLDNTYIETIFKSPEQITEENLTTNFELLEKSRNKGKNKQFLLWLKNIPLVGKVFYNINRYLQIGLNLHEVRSKQYWYEKSINDNLIRLSSRNALLNAKINQLESKSFTLEVRNEDLALQNLLLEEKTEKLNKELKEKFEDLHKKLENKTKEFNSKLEEKFLPFTKITPPYLFQEDKFFGKKWEDSLLQLQQFQGDDTEEFQKEAFGYFHNLIFRGSFDDVYGKLNELMEYISIDSTDNLIVDIGCGKGEFLKYLDSIEKEYLGVDNNKFIVDSLNDNGYKAIQDDAIRFLENQKDSSLGGITAFHVLEHIPIENLFGFAKLSIEKLDENGFVIFQLPNPHCPPALGFFYADPSHIKPISPYYIAFTLKYAGFNHVSILFHEPLTVVEKKDLDNKKEIYQDYTIFAKK